MFGSSSSKRKLTRNKIGQGFEQFESRHLLTGLPLISELSIGSYIEFEGTPNAIIPNGTYLGSLHAKTRGTSVAGDLDAVLDLSGLQFGSNGFLVVQHDDSTASVHPDATTIVGTSGLNGLPDDRFSQQNGYSQFAFLGHVHSYLLFESSTVPVPGTDYDINDDGTLDNGAENWLVRDSIAHMKRLDFTEPYVVYAETVVRAHSDLEPNPIIMPLTATVINWPGTYSARIGTGSSEMDWMIKGNWGAHPYEYHDEVIDEHVGSANFPGVQLVGGSVGEYPGNDTFNDLAISEVLLHRYSDNEDSFIELAGLANDVIPHGTYFVTLLGAGQIESVIDLGNIQVGSNGTITFLQANNGFTVDSASTTLTGTDGFRGMPDFRYQGYPTLGVDSSKTYMIIQSEVRPISRNPPSYTSIENDYDSYADMDQDGVLDEAASKWHVIDSVAVTTSTSAIPYSDKVVFRTRDAQGIPQGASREMDLKSLDYFVRIADTGGANDFIAGRVDYDQATPFDFFIGIHFGVYPPYPNNDVVGYELNHIGQQQYSFQGGNNGGGNNGGNNVEDIIGRTSGGEIWAAESDGTQFINKFIVEWPTNTTWSDVQLADVNGDGQQDVVGRNSDGDWYVTLAGEVIQNYQKWGHWSSSVTWEDVNAADVNGDGLTDIVGRANGQWWVAVSNGSYFTIEYWGSWSNSVTWEDVLVGDYNGDGNDDIAGRANGQWWISKSNGSNFLIEYWGRWSNSVTWDDVVTGDFDGDGSTDIAGRTSGTWWLANSQNTFFTTEYWGRWSNSVTWQDVTTGDFNGDGLTDIAGRVNGEWWLARSAQTAFLTEYWGQWADVAWKDVRRGDFDGDGDDDLAGRYQNQWWLEKSNGSSFGSEHWGQWGATVWNDVLAGVFRTSR